MLRDLAIKNFAIAEDVTFSLGEGFTVITGETGAGKSILVDALGLLSGGRASSEMLRHDTDRMVVAARFDAAPPLSLLLSAAGIPEGEEILLRREMSADGRGRTFVNDEPVSAKTAARIGDALLTIHGQSGEQSLLAPDSALELLDDFGDLETLAKGVGVLSASLRDLRRLKASLEEAGRDRVRRLDMLEFEVREIDEARLDGVDEEALAAERNRLSHADRIRSLAHAALSALSEDEGAAADRVGEAFKAFGDLARIDGSYLDAEREASELKSRIADLASAARGIATGIESDPDRLSALESRLERISRLKKKYGASIPEILEHRARASAERDRLVNLEVSLGDLEREVGRAEKEYAVRAAELSSGRRKAAERFSALVRSELADLAMEKARFRVELLPRPEDFSPRGREVAEILFSPNPGEAEKPLVKVASGGELSRVALAIESASTSHRRSRFPRTLIFDEVDAGIGGHVAEVVGRKLQALSRKDQILCVTHVPQIAALAHRQFQVSKKVARGRTMASVLELARADRIEEIARMLAGEKITATARDHARVLLGGR